MLHAAVARLVADLVEAGATVYGPAVRDLLLAARHAKGHALCGGGNDSDGKFWARTLAPREVAAYVGTEDLGAVEDVLALSHLHVVALGSWGIQDYPAAAVSRRYRVSLARPEVVDAESMIASLAPELRRSPEVADAARRFAEDMRAACSRGGCDGRRSVELDLVALPRGTPFRHPRVHYDVDGLCLSRRGVWLSPTAFVNPNSSMDLLRKPMAVHARLLEVLDALHALRASYLPAPPTVAVDPTAVVALVTDARWTVVPVVVVPGPEGAYEGHCIVCHDEVPGGAGHVKMRCCDARYHAGCLRLASERVYVSRACVMCRRPVDPMSLFVDLCRLQCIDVSEKGGHCAVQTEMAWDEA